MHLPAHALRVIAPCAACCAMIAIACCSVVVADDTDEDLVQMVLGLLQDPDKDLRALGLEQIRSAAPGEGVTRRFAAALADIPTDAQVGLLSALADRGDAAALPEVRQAIATSRDETVRVAAIQALGRLGTAADLPLLLKPLSASSPAEQAAAQASLVQLRGDEVPSALAAELARAPTELRITLLKVLVDRRAHSALDQIVPLAVERDVPVRRAAMQALGELADGRHLPGMLQGVLHAAVGEERETAEKAVMFACRRIEDPSERSQQLLEAFQPLSPRDRQTLLPTLGRVGGDAVMSVIETALADPAQREAGLRAISNWPDATVAPRLIELYRAEKDPKRQAILLLALVRVAPLPDGRSDSERLELLQTVFGMCSRVGDKTLVIQRARAVRTVETLRFVLPLADQSALAEAACETIVELAHHRNLRESNKAEFDAALDKVLAVSRNATSRDRAQRYKKGQTWVRPKS